MSIASAIENAQLKVQNAYRALEEKGAILPEVRNLENLPDSILTVSDMRAQEKTVTPTTEEQVITPDVEENYNALSSVIVSGVTSEIDSNITPSNIKGGVSILGVTGGIYVGDCIVRVVDYDGTVLKEVKDLGEGAQVELPEPPRHEGLIFQGWSSPVDIVDNKVTVTNSDINIGPMYETVSGFSEFDVVVTEVTGSTVYLNLSGNKDWGDGNIDDSNFHTYVSPGRYTITYTGNDTIIPSYVNSSSGGVSKDYTLVSVRLSSNIRTIQDGAFYGCSSLVSITMPRTLSSIQQYPFDTCTSLVSVIIPEAVEEVGSFPSCFSLRFVVLPKYLKTLGSNAFQDCFSLDSISIPQSVTDLGLLTFRGCSFKNAVIPNGISSLSISVFQNCNYLNRLYIPESVRTFDSNLFDGCESLKLINIPEGVTAIPECAFRSTMLHEIELPTTLKSIGDYSFRYCKFLKTLRLPVSLESIGLHAFSDCINITSVKFFGNNPSSSLTISGHAFKSCTSVTEYDFTSFSAVPTLSHTNAFSEISKICKIKVPLSLEAEWKSATNWSTFVDYIVGV